jgi:hypothetical protein
MEQAAPDARTAIGSASIFLRAPMNNQLYRSTEPQRPPAQIVQQEAYQFSRVALINPDGSYFMQWQAG